jgi:hypothetical protein
LDFETGVVARGVDLDVICAVDWDGGDGDWIGGLGPEKAGLGDEGDVDEVRGGREGSYYSGGLDWDLMGGSVSWVVCRV